MADNKGKSKYSCDKCGKTYSSKQYHLISCEYSVESIDYIKCKICSHKALALYAHIKKHGLSRKEYENLYGTIFCENSLKNIIERNKQTQKKSNYRNRLKAEGRFSELAEFNERVSEKVSHAIMCNDELRQLRSQTLSNLNKTTKFRQKASDTAKITSSRKDIQENRSKVLKKWRDENPDKFNDIIKSLQSFSSRPEKELFTKIKQLFPEFQFKKNQQLKHKNFLINKTARKQIDIFSKERKIIIEFDGELHFKNIKKWNQLDLIKKKDEELNSLKNEFCIIRVSYDQFSYRQSDFGFTEDCLNKIQEIIKDPRPSLHLIGESYAKNQIN
jgi:very-short-patch-repair endonuclease